MDFTDFLEQRKGVQKPKDDPDDDLFNGDFFVCFFHFCFDFHLDQKPNWNLLC